MHDEKTLKKHEDILQLAREARSIEEARDHFDDYARSIDELSEAFEAAREAVRIAVSAIESLDAAMENLAHVDSSALLDEADKVKDVRPEFRFEERQFEDGLDSMREAVAALDGFVQDMDHTQLKNLDDRLVSLDWNLEKNEDVIRQADRAVGQVYGTLWLASYTLPENVTRVDMTEVVAMEQETPLSHPVHDLRILLDDYAETQAARNGRTFTDEEGHLYVAGTDARIDADAEDLHVLDVAGYRRSLHELETRDDDVL